MSEHLDPDVAEPIEDIKPTHYPLWNVVLINDDYTPMDFVVDILVEYFNHTTEVATFIMFDVHTEGKGIAGTYSRDVAETKAAIVIDRARNAGHPLAVGIEPAE
jgi:ATP-dependent Clp protease adaptor protein ClpS